MKLSLFFILFLSSSVLLCARTWTNDKGQEIEAEIVDVENGAVFLKLDKNSREYKVSLNTLSEADRDFAEQWVKRKKEKPEKKGHKFISNYDKDWPKEIVIDTSFEIELGIQDSEENKFVYHSPNYTFVCDVRLSKVVVKQFSRLFEATLEYCKQLPISLQKPRFEKKERYKIVLVEKLATYYRLGGPVGSVGVYKGSEDIIIVPLTSIGVKRLGKGYTYDYDKSNETLPHEITHQLTDWALFSEGARGWFTEGLAEYISVTKYRNGRFSLRQIDKDVVESVVAYGRNEKGGSALGERIRAPHLKEYMLQPYTQFAFQGFARRNYALGLLYVYYFFHLDGDGDRKAITSFLNALRNGKNGEDSLKFLLNGRSYEELQEDIAKALKKEGVELIFQMPTKSDAE